jgi:tetratricopeptide (TPR) repeat protein
MSLESSQSATERASDLLGLLEECQKLAVTDPGRCVAVARQAHEIAKQSDDRVAMGRSLYWAGVGVRQTSDLLSAASLLRESNAILYAAGDTLFQARALQAIGTIHSASGELTEAVECFERALELARANKDSYTIARTLNSWGIVAIRKADYTRAFELYDECLTHLRTAPDPYLEASILSNLAGIYQRMGDYPAALDACHRSLAVPGRLNDYRQDANCQVMMADTLCYMGRWSEANDTITRVLELARAHDYVDIEAIAYRTLVEISKNVGDDSRSVELLEEARSMAQATGSRLYLQKIETELGLALCRLGENVRAKETLDNALALADAANSPQLLAETHLALAAYYERVGDVRRATDELRYALQQNAVLHSDANKLALRRLERRVTPENTRRVQTSEGLLDAVLEVQTRLLRSIMDELQHSAAAIQSEAVSLGSAGLQVERRAAHMSELLAQLALIDKLEA